MKKNVLTKSVFAALLLASTVVVAEEYPATDFQPTVVYSENAGSSSSESSETKTASSQSSAPEVKAEKAESSNTMLFGLVLAAVAGGFFLSRKPKASSAKSTSETAAPSYSAGGQTGVERYLQAQNASAATGVEKYLAKKEAVDNEASLTGVDKYLRNRG